MYEKVTSFLFRIGFGQPKPPAPQLPRTVDACNITEDIINSSNNNNNNKDSPNSEDFFYPYTISYAWYALIGFVLALVVGATVSVLWPDNKGDGGGGGSGGGGSRIDPDLLMDCLRHRNGGGGENVAVDDDDRLDDVTKL